MSGDHFKRENFPTDGGESFLADWHEIGANVNPAAGAASQQMQQSESLPQVGDNTIEIADGGDVQFAVEVKPASKPIGPEDGFNWYPSEDLG